MGGAVVVVSIGVGAEIVGEVWFLSLVRFSDGMGTRSRLLGMGSRC